MYACGLGGRAGRALEGQQLDPIHAKVSLSKIIAPDGCVNSVIYVWQRKCCT